MVLKSFSLEGKVAVVAGEGRGWLAELAGYLAEAGADVALAAQDKKQLDNGVKMVEKWGKRALAIPTDVTIYSQVEAMVARVVSSWGKIDILVNNMDLMFAKPMIEVTPEEWQQVISANLTPVFLCTRAVGKHMMARKEGKVITISSVLAERGLPNSTAYCAARGGVSQFTRALALEWAAYNIRVNGIGVGWLPENARGDKAENLEHYITLKRFARPDDIGALLVYLASDGSSNDTGQTLYVSGSVMAHG